MVGGVVGLRAGQAGGQAGVAETELRDWANPSGATHQLNPRIDLPVLITSP